MNADKILFRASAISQIMTGTSKGWDMKKSVTAQNYCKQLFRELKYKRKQSITNKYMEKGLSEEEAAITLLSRVKKNYYKKNEEWITNDFVSGTPDIFEGESINKANQGYDTKCSWGLFTFPFASDELDKEYYYQDMTYMALTGAGKWTTVFCLVNASDTLIDSEKKKAWYQMGCHADKAFKDKCIAIEKNMIFDMKQFRNDNPLYDFDCEEWDFDIPMQERIIEFEVQRDDKEIERIYNRIKECRAWMNDTLYRMEEKTL